MCSQLCGPWKPETGADPALCLLIVARLEEAGATLLALPNRGPPLGMRVGWPEVVHDFHEAYGWTEATLRPPRPLAAQISRMDEALAWITLIPSDRYVLRRIVGCRALVAPITGRHLFSWRRIGRLIGADDKSIPRWHAQGIALIAEALQAQKISPKV
jgi:hypothetical protein